MGVNTFFIGDTHFGHKNIIKFEATREFRRFDSIEEHDEELVRRWNNVVRPGDVVWHLGDFAFGRCGLEIAGRLNGDKRLVLGNHDQYGAGEYLKYFSRVVGVRELGDGVLTHIPVHPSQLEYRYKYNIHGHLHTGRVRNGLVEDPRYVCVSAEQIGLAPISLEEVRGKIAKGL